MHKVVIRELSHGRLSIELDRTSTWPDPQDSITFDHPNAAHAAALVVEAWVNRASGQNHRSSTRYLPELVLEHAADWGMQ